MLNQSYKDTYLSFIANKSVRQGHQIALEKFQKMEASLGVDVGEAPASAIYEVIDSCGALSRSTIVSILSSLRKYRRWYASNIHDVKQDGLEIANATILGSIKSCLAESFDEYLWMLEYSPFYSAEFIGVCLMWLGVAEPINLKKDDVEIVENGVVIKGGLVADTSVSKYLTEYLNTNEIQKQISIFAVRPRYKSNTGRFIEMYVREEEIDTATITASNLFRRITRLNARCIGEEKRVVREDIMLSGQIYRLRKIYEENGSVSIKDIFSESYRKKGSLPNDEDIRNLTFLWNQYLLSKNEDHN